MSVSNCHSKPRDVTEGRGPHLHRGKSLKSRINCFFKYNLVYTLITVPQRDAVSDLRVIFKRFAGFCSFLQSIIFVSDYIMCFLGVNTLKVTHMNICNGFSSAAEEMASIWKCSFAKHE